MKTRKTKIKMKKKVRKFTKNDISEPLGELKHLAHISTRYFCSFWSSHQGSLDVWFPKGLSRTIASSKNPYWTEIVRNCENFIFLVAIVLVISPLIWAKRYLILTAWTKVGKRCYTNQQLIKLKNRQVRYCWDFVFVFHIENRFFVQVCLVYRPHGHYARSQAD